MDTPLVSVIMANYKTKIEYLKEAIESILNQTYTNFELIIIDDCSQDESVEYIQSLSDSRIVVMINEKNSGPAVSRNKGIDASKGKYIAVMDSDDISLPNRLQVEVDYMENNPDVIVCGSWFEKFGVENYVRKPVIDDFEIYRCQLLFSNTPTTLCSPSAMIRKSMLDEHRIRYDESLLKTEDYGLWVDCSKVARFHIIKEVLVKYRTHAQQTSIKDFSEQDKYSDLISRRQLQSLGIDYREEEKRWRFDVVKNRNDYMNFYSWINQIIYYNNDKGFYDTSTLKKYLDIKLSNGLKRMKTKEEIKTFFTTNPHTVVLFFRLAIGSLCRRIKK